MATQFQQIRDQTYRLVGLRHPANGAHPQPQADPFRCSARLKKHKSQILDVAAADLARQWSCALTLGSALPVVSFATNDLSFQTVSEHSLDPALTDVRQFITVSWELRFWIGPAGVIGLLEMSFATVAVATRLFLYFPGLGFSPVDTPFSNCSCCFCPEFEKIKQFLWEPEAGEPHLPFAAPTHEPLCVVAAIPGARRRSFCFRSEFT